MIVRTILCLVAVVMAQEVATEFEIRKRHPRREGVEVVGKLSVNVLGQHQIVEAEVEPFVNELVRKEDFEAGSPIILEFVAVKSTSEAYQGRVYMTSIDELNEDAHGQKISIVTGLDHSNLQITSINYVQTRNKVGEIYTEVLYTREEEGEIFKYIPQAKKSEQDEESFFSRYKWPLIIGGVVLYTMMSMDPEKGQQAAAPRS